MSEVTSSRGVGRDEEDILLKNPAAGLNGDEVKTVALI